METEVSIEENYDSDFWQDATQYTKAASEDESFVNEMAYVMVTLHRTGA